MNWIKRKMERSAFGVCHYLGRKMGVASSRVRVYFIYLTFLTFGSPIVIYLFTAFWLNIRRYLKRGKNMIWN
ncbi:MAG: PspC family transcriptional regulator [Bacteroidota bacterium]